MILDREADVALEDAIKSKAAQGPALLPQWMPTCFVVVTVLASFCIGLIFGWGPFPRYFLTRRRLRQLRAGRHNLPCDAQILLYALFYSLASCTLSLADCRPVSSSTLTASHRRVGRGRRDCSAASACTPRESAADRLCRTVHVDGVWRCHDGIDRVQVGRDLP